MDSAKILFGSTVLFVIRRSRAVEPSWSWLRMFGAFTGWVLLATLISFVPAVGSLAALAVAIVGVKKLSGLDWAWALVLPFLTVVAVFILIGVIGSYLEMDFLGWAFGRISD